MSRILPGETVDLADLSEPDRFGVWHDIISRGTVPSRFDSPHADNFAGFARVVDLGMVRLTAFRYPALTMTRTERLIRQSDPEMYELALPLTGDGALVQERRQSVVRPAEFMFFTTSKPYLCQHLPQQEAGPDAAVPATAKTVAVLFPQSAIPLPPNKVNRLLAERLPAEGMAALLGRLLVQVAEHPEQFRATDATQLGGMALDLISAMLAQHLDLQAALPAEVRQQTLRARIDAFINEHLGDVELSARTVAAAHHISMRTLYRLFQGEGESVAELIRRRRLERCQRDLANPLMASQPIYAVAARWGFADMAHFRRLFSAAYGMSPQSYRRRRSGLPE